MRALGDVYKLIHKRTLDSLITLCILIDDREADWNIYAVSREPTVGPLGYVLEGRHRHWPCRVRGRTRGPTTRGPVHCRKRLPTAVREPITLLQTVATDEINHSKVQCQGTSQLVS